MGEMGRWGENKERGLKRLAYRNKPTNQKLPLLSFFLIIAGLGVRRVLSV